MSSPVVRALKISKEFVVFQNQRTLASLAKSFLYGEPFYKKFDGLSDLTFQVDRGEKLAIVGENGAGKTTLLRLLAGIYKATSGILDIPLLPSIFFRFSIGATRELSVIETINLLAAIYRIPATNLSEDVENIIEMSGLVEFRDSSTKVLSYGQYQRLALSVFFHVKSEFVIFDESLTYLDAKFVKQCESYFDNLTKSDKTLIMTSHDNTFLRKYCRTAMWIEHGKLKKLGPIDQVLCAYENSSQ